MTQPWPLWGSESSHGTVLNFYVTNYNTYITDVEWTFSVSNPNYKTIEQVCESQHLLSLYCKSALLNNFA